MQHEILAYIKMKVAQHPFAIFLAWLTGMGVSLTELEPILQVVGLILGILVAAVTLWLKIEELRAEIYDRELRETEENDVQ